MDSSTFSSSSKDVQLFEFAISGLYGELLSKQYGDQLVSDVSLARDAIRDLIAKSVESREQAVHLSKQWFGENAASVIHTFQQRLAEANKVPKKSKRSSSKPKVVKTESSASDSKVVKLDAGESTVVEVVEAASSKKSKMEKQPEPVVQEDAKPPVPDMKKMKSGLAGKKRKVGADSESEA